MPVKKGLTLDGREYRTDPLECSMDRVAARLEADKSISVTLEPGDATRYELLLVPMWAPEVELHNWSLEDRQHGLVVTRLIGGEPMEDRPSVIILLNRTYRGHKLIQLANGNAWTAELLDKWFDLLAIELAEQRGEEPVTSEITDVD